MANESRQESCENKMSTKDFLMGALIGGLVGATTALFLAPKSGRELRDNINGQATIFKEKAGTWSDTAKEKSNDMALTAKEKVAQTKDKTISLSKNVQEQSSVLLNKVKVLQKSQNNDHEIESENTDSTEEINQKLKEAQQALEETEKTLQQEEK